MRGALRMVPWTGLPEWTYVAQCVREHECSRDALLEALNWLHIWTVRGNVPPAAETTYSLLEIKRCMLETTERAGKEQEAGQGTSLRCLQLALAAALVRFVNEVVDPEQQGVFARPVSQLAERMDIPRLLVDIRHGATHDTLPSCEVLLLGMELALGWLREHYWCPQAAWAASVREATERAIERFLVAVKETDPLTKSPLAVAIRCLHEVPQVETSSAIQVPFFETIMGSSHPIDKLLPLLGAVLGQNDAAVITLLAVTLNSPGDDPRSLSAIDYGASLIKSESTLAICARDCLKRCTPTSRIFLQRILAGSRVAISAELQELMELLMDASPPRVIHGADDLIGRTEQLLGDHLREEEQAASLEHGWHHPRDWKPRPWGVTKHFNPVTDFQSLVGSND